jgi:hypothetical protein
MDGQVVKLPRFALRFSTRRLLVAMAVQAVLLAVIARLAGHGHVYEEEAILHVYAPVDWKEGHYPDDVTYVDLLEHQRRLLSPTVLERAARLLNDRGSPTSVYHNDPLVVGVRVWMQYVVGILPDGSVLTYQPDPQSRHYTGAELRRRLRTEILRTRPDDPDLPDKAVLVFATSESQGEAKSIACHVVEAYYEIAGEWVSPSSGSPYKIPVPFLDNPWKIAGSILISVLIPTVILCYPKPGKGSQAAWGQTY